MKFDLTYRVGNRKAMSLLSAFSHASDFENTTPEVAECSTYGTFDSVEECLGFLTMMPHDGTFSFSVLDRLSDPEGEVYEPKGELSFRDALKWIIDRVDRISLCGVSFDKIGHRVYDFMTPSLIEYRLTEV